MLNKPSVSETIFSLPKDQYIVWSVWFSIYDNLNTPIRNCVWNEYRDILEFVLESYKC